MNTISVPVPNYVNDGNTLAEWLGYFWNRVYENPEFTRNMQQGQGLLSAQLYLDYLESLSLRDRNSVPVFHREKWKPLLIRKSQAGTGDGSLLRIGMTPTPVIGPQTGQTFVPDQTFQIGGSAAFTNAISYPFAGVAGVMTCIVDNILVPTVVLTQGVDFTVKDNTVFFLRSGDPFKLDFARRTFTNEAGEADQEIVLWASDVLIDRDYVYNFLGYVMGLKTESSEFYQRMLNSLWTLYNDGTPLQLLYSAVAAMLGEPTIVSPTETVDRIIDEADYRLVVTDKRVYRVSLSGVLRSSVVPGAVLNAGELLTETIRIYETLDPMKLTAANEYGTRIKTDVSSLFFDVSMLKSRLQFGIGATWDEVKIVSAGPDANGNAKLMFKIYGSDEDVTTFWSDFWTYCESQGIASQTCFSDYVNGIVLPATVGTVYGTVQPMEYFMRYFLKANAFIIVVDRDNLTEVPGDRDPMGLLALLHKALPAHVLMLVVERRGADTVNYDMDGLDSSLVKAYVKLLTTLSSYGYPSKVNMTYMDCRPRIKWIPVCKNRPS